MLQNSRGPKERISNIPFRAVCRPLNLPRVCTEPVALDYSVKRKGTGDCVGCDSLPRPRTSSFVFTAGTTSEDGTEDGRPGLHAVGFNDLPDDVGAAGATPTPVPAPRPSELMQDMFDGLDADTSDVESLQAMDPANGLNNDIEVVADYDRFTSTVM